MSTPLPDILVYYTRPGSRASFQGRRRVTAVTMVPNRIRSVRTAMTANATEGSNQGVAG